MREVLPNACFIAFTGTPIAKKEKSTFAKFGDLVQPSYSMRDAVSDKPSCLCSMKREVVTDVDEARLTAGSRSTPRTVRQAEDGPEAQDEPAREIEALSHGSNPSLRCGQHFSNNFKGTG